MYAKTGRWFSWSWWQGHNDTTDGCGQWAPDDRAGKPCRNRGVGSAWRDHQSAARRRRADKLAGKATKTKRRGAGRVAARARIRADFDDYLEARYLEAENATRGNLVTNAAARRGMTGREWFRAGRRPGRASMSDELREWFDRGGGRAVLTFEQYRAQQIDQDDEHAWFRQRKAA